jgi:hypothetical protein
VNRSVHTDIRRTPRTGGRITVRDVDFRVEYRGLSPERVAERYDLDVAAVYEALAYYHSTPAEMRAVERHHVRAVTVVKNRRSLTPPDA